MSDDPSVRQTLGKRLAHERDIAGLTLEEAAAASGVSRSTIIRYESGATSQRAETIEALRRAYGARANGGTGDTSKVSRGTTDRVREKYVGDSGGWSPNPSLRGMLPTRAYEVAIGYCRRLAAVGLPAEDVEEAERLFIDEAYAKLNRRTKRELTEDEHIQIIDATWEIMREALSWRGLRP